MLNIMRNYKVEFSVKGKTKLKEEIIEAKSKKDVKIQLIGFGYIVDEIISCYEVRKNNN